MKQLRRIKRVPLLGGIQLFSVLIGFVAGFVGKDLAKEKLPWLEKLDFLKK